MLSVIRAIADRLGCNSRLLRPEPVFVIIVFSIQWDIGLLFAMKLAASLTPNCWRRVPASLNLALGIWHVSRQTRVQEVVSSVHYWNTFCIFVRLFLCRRSRSYSSGHRSSAVHSVCVSLRHFVQCSSQTCLQFSVSDVRGRPTADRQTRSARGEGRAEAARGAGGRKSGAGDGRSP